MSPVARLLVFYVREDGEIVADARMFRIAHCLLNKVKLHFRHEQQYPSSEASMLLSASPSSVCGIGLVDKSVRLIRQDEQFKRENVFKLLQKYDVGKESHPRQVNDDYCMQKRRRSTRMTTRIRDDFYNPFSRSVSHHVDTTMAFEEAGMVVMSNFELGNRPCVDIQPVADDLTSDIAIYPERGRYRNFGPRTRMRMRPGLRMEPTQPPLVEIRKAEPPKKHTQAEEIRSYFPETWLWEMHTVGSSGQTVLKRQLPHTITQWVGGAVCVHPKTGLGMWEESSVTAFQPFFVSFNLPYSVVRGEVLPLTVSVFNYLSECLPIKLSLEPSEEYRIVSENRWHRMCVCGGESRSHRFTLEPTALGRVNVTVYGFSLEDDDLAVCGNEVTARLSARDAVSKQLLVEAEGFPKEEVLNYFVCPENTNGTYATEVDLLLPEDVVEGSGRAFVSVTGDLMGPALDGLSSLVRLPVGCGEQNMVLFVPNIFVLDYLTSTYRITDEVKKDCLNNMQTGYQRELNYRHKDGSYSAFGPSDQQGSLWLTAFVVRSFGQARRFMDMDEQDLMLSTSWIVDKQFENGCFEPHGRLLNKAMKGGLTDGEHSLAPLTAYVLISLLEAGVVGPDQAVVRTGLMCLKTEENPSSYTLALFAYANTLASETATANKYLKQLEDRAIVRDGQMYWGSGSKSVDVETAGYYILSRTQLDGRESVATVLPVIRWLTEQRNSQGGFVSTQDTVVALQALARYAYLQSTTPLDIGLVVESDELVKGFKLDEDNKLVTQMIQIPVLPAVVDLQAVGDGCALVQFSMRYNVEKVSGSEAFDLNINAVRLGSSECNLPRIDICMRYKFPNQTTNMVVVSVKMASGFVPDEWSLFELQSNTAVQLKRHELDGNQVNLYFNELTNEQKCFMFFIKSETDVEEIKPSSVKLYDYYQPELQITKEYTIPSGCTALPLPEQPTSENDVTTVKMPEVAHDIDAANDDEENSLLDQEVKSISTEPTRQHDESTWEDNTEAPQSTHVESETEIMLTESTSNGISRATQVPYDVESSEGRTVNQYDPTESTTGSDVIAEEPLVTMSSSDDQIELADDASLYQEERNMSHLVNFVDVDHDLDFPDGLEGNLPISVLPPTLTSPQSEISESTEDEAEMNCPICLTEFPKNFTDIYCNSAFALRVVVKDGKAGTVKILQEISYFLPQPKPMKKFAKLDFDSSCSCPQLQEGSSVHFILGTPTDLWHSETEKHRIHLTNQVHIISSPSKTAQPEKLRRARRMCNNDP